MLLSVSSEKTTPQPKVSSGPLRSSTRMRWRGSRPFISRLKNRPAGPPPTTVMSMAIILDLKYLPGQTAKAKALDPEGGSWDRRRQAGRDWPTVGAHVDCLSAIGRV